MLNEDNIPDYFKSARLILLFKSNKTKVNLNETRAKSVLLHRMNVFEKALKTSLKFY